MTRELNVYLYGQKAGVLSEDTLGNLQFQYTNANSAPLSVRIPVKTDIYDRFYTEPFFDNLMPEGNALTLIASRYHISENNIFSVLNKIGGECAGAVALYADELQHNIDKPLKLIDADDITQIIDELPKNPLLTGLSNAPRLSLAGAQSKFAVVKDAYGKYYRSDDEHPTTHIIKITNAYYPNLLENELFCMSLAKKIFGGKSVDVVMRMTNGRKYLEIARYDRKTTQDGIVQRIHQEDFCQVLGCLSRRKYQSDGGPKIPEIYNAIMQYSAGPASDAYKFIRMLIFNYLIGNTDAHAKNFSFLHVDCTGSVVLAPAYDLVSIEMYPENTVSHEIAMTINGKGKYKAVTKKDWMALFAQLKLNPTTTLNELRNFFADVVNKAKQTADELNTNQISRSDIYDKIANLIQQRFDALLAK